MFPLFPSIYSTKKEIEASVMFNMFKRKFANAISQQPKLIMSSGRTKDQYTLAFET